MRLLHTTKLTFEEFFDADTPPYAILSHRWGSDEVSYQDFLAGRKRDGVGYEKIIASCKYATDTRLERYLSRPGLNVEAYRISIFEAESVKNRAVSQPVDWIWIDTCCIDKSSSAELTEAINSMYRWYRNAVICYVFLKDVKICSTPEETRSEFCRSNWFTRGWTLQELIAPRHVIFLDMTWNEIGTRAELRKLISRVAGISVYYLGGYWNPLNAALAEKMRWAVKRRTSRIEDQAYCLLGIFNINMPLLYGEGTNAFHRLQLEVIRSSDDESIFAWDPNIRPTIYKGILAKNPDDFFDGLDEGERDWEVRPISSNQRSPYAITNKGLEFHIPAELAERDRILLPLNCGAYRGYDLQGVYFMELERDPSTGSWRRIRVRTYSRQYLSGLRNLGNQELVSQFNLWNRESLKKSGSDVVYLKL